MIVQQTKNDLSGKINIIIIIEFKFIFYEARLANHNSSTIHCKNRIVKIKMYWLVQLQGFNN